MQTGQRAVILTPGASLSISSKRELYGYSDLDASVRILYLISYLSPPSYIFDPHS